MQYTVHIGGVDGMTNFVVHTTSPALALEFVKTHDHEGASVNLTISSRDEEVYPTLRVLMGDSEKQVEDSEE